MVPVPLTGATDAPVVLARIERAAGPVHAVDVAGTRLQVPVMPRVLTSVTFGAAEGLCVRLYDVDLLGDPVAVLWLDRLQDILAAGRTEAAQTLLDQVRLTYGDGRLGGVLSERFDAPDAAAPGSVRGAAPWPVTAYPVGLAPVGARDS